MCFSKLLSGRATARLSRQTSSKYYSRKRFHKEQTEFRERMLNRSLGGTRHTDIFDAREIANDRTRRVAQTNSRHLDHWREARRLLSPKNGQPRIAGVNSSFPRLGR